MALTKSLPKTLSVASSCEGRHRFTDGGMAHKVAKEQRRRKDAPVEAYRCEHCGGWHIGVSLRPKSQRTNTYGR